MNTTGSKSALFPLWSILVTFGVGAATGLIKARRGNIVEHDYMPVVLGTAAGITLTCALIVWVACLIRPQWRLVAPHALIVSASLAFIQLFLH